jgi:hypothetical protein
VNRKEIILLLVLLTLFTFFVQWTGAEQRSFYSLILALNNEQSLSIDRYESMTPDKAFYNGHYYSDKAPGLPLLGLPVFAALDAMQGLQRPGLLLPYSVYMVSAFVVSLPSALLALLILRFLRRLGVGEAQAMVTTLVMALGTMAFPFSTLFFSHQTSAFLVFASFYAIFLAKSDARPARLLFAAGLLAGSAVVVEYPMAIMAALLLGYTLATAGDRRLALWYVLGGLPPAALLMAYNTAAFGHPLHFSYFYTVNTWAQVHQQGFLGLGLPRLSTLLTVLVGARGLFTLSPVLLLSIYGFWRIVRERAWRAEGILAALAVGVYVLMTSGYKVPPTDIWSPGPRFLVPVLPFLAAPLAFSLRRLRWLFAPLAAISMLIMFVVTAANPQAPPEIANPLFDYWLPGFLDRSQLVNTLPSLRFGISRGLSVLLLLVALGGGGGLAACAYLASKRPHTQRAILTITAVYMVVVYLALAFPIDLRRPFSVPRSLQGPTVMATDRSHHAQT